MKLVKYTLIIFIYLLGGFLFGGNHKWMILTTLISVFVTCSYFLSKINTKYRRKELIKILFPLFLLLMVISINSTFYYSLAYLIFLPVIGLLSYWYVKKQSTSKMIVVMLVVSFATFIFFPNQLAFFNKSNISGSIPYVELDLFDVNGQKVYFDTDKTIVLDFWTTKCGVCFEKFPDYENVFKHYKDDVRVEVYAVNTPLKIDVFSETLELFQKLNYEFPTLFLSKDYDLEKKYNVESYPHVLVIKNQHITYSGRIETSPFVFVDNLYYKINKTLKQ